MKIHQLFRVIFLGLTSTLFSCDSSNSSELLPEDFKVYIGENSVINHPEDGYTEKTLPTFNHYKGKDGGYVAFYTREKEGSVYGCMVLATAFMFLDKLEVVFFTPLDTVRAAILPKIIESLIYVFNICQSGKKNQCG